MSKTHTAQSNIKGTEMTTKFKTIQTRKLKTEKKTCTKQQRKQYNSK